MATPVALSIAGSDSSGCAGAQADLATFAAHGVHGAVALSAVTAQSTAGVQALHPLPPELVRAQIESVLDHLQPRALKIGMLGPAGVVRAIAMALRAYEAPLVLDPVAGASSGQSFLWEDSLGAQLAPLRERVTLLTPNLPEARALAGTEPLADWCARQPCAVLLKGGHGPGDPLVDRLYRPGLEPIELRHRRLEGAAARGTGCTLSSALAARLARGDDLESATRGAIDYVQAALRASLGRDPELGLIRPQVVAAKEQR